MNKLVNLFLGLSLILVTTCFFAMVSADNCYISHGINTTAQIQIVTKHNAYRSKVAAGNETREAPGPQPAAKNMKAVKWDADLATTAQRWADQCIFDHDTNANRKTTKYPNAGQNIGIRWTSSASLNEQTVRDTVIQLWYDEVAQFNKSLVNSYKFDPNTGHYTQLVWADTVAIGCGYSFYKINSTYSGLFVCNYGPAGNVGSQPVYHPTTTLTQACSECNVTCTDKLCPPPN